MEDASKGLSSFVAKYLGLSMGVECIVAEAAQTATSLSCVTGALEEAVWTDPASVLDAKYEAFAIATWNDKEIYSECAVNCTFDFSAVSTPVLVLNVSRSSLLLRGAYDESDDGPLKLVAGDWLVFEAPRSTGGAFDWSAATASELSFTLNGVELSVLELYGSTLAGHIGPDVPPAAVASLELLVKPFGRGVVLLPGGGSSISVVPVITAVSHTQGSNAGGLQVTIQGPGVGWAGAAVTVGGRPCTSPRIWNASTVTCLTSAGATEGVGEVVVSALGVLSACLAPPRFDPTDPAFVFNSTSNSSEFVNASSKFVLDGCAFRFNDDLTHTPRIAELSPTVGHWPQTLTITGQGFAASGNVVVLGRRPAELVSENSTHIHVVVPKHVGGTYRLSVTVPGKGLATGPKLWFRFESGITEVSPKSGSKYAGQRITLTGFGFAPAGDPAASASVDSEALAYASLFNSWVNYGTANSTVPFELDVSWATFDTIVATTHYHGARALDGDARFDWIPSLSVDVANPFEGFVGVGTYAQVWASANSGGIKAVFDGDPMTAFDGYGAGKNLEVTYAAYEPFLLTDYQLLWECEAVNF